jgi:hypothetical protein
MVKQVRLILAAPLLLLASCETFDKLTKPAPVDPTSQAPAPVDPTPQDPLDRGDVIIAGAKQTANTFGFGEAAAAGTILLAGAWGLYKKLRKNDASAQGGDVQTP